MAYIFECQHCGKSFASKEKVRVFCSLFCKLAGCITRPNARPLIVTCDQCGNEFDYLDGPKDFAKTVHHFCNLACANAWRRDGGNPSGEAHPEYSRLKVTCAQCGAELTREPWRLKQNQMQFCNRKCQGAWRSENWTGENHPRWRGGSVPDYGPNWLRQAEAARKRDGYRCQHCGVHQHELKTKLHVHHVKSLREFGYVFGENENYKEANDLANLKSLCPSCHMSNDL